MLRVFQKTETEHVTFKAGKGRHSREGKRSRGDRETQCKALREMSHSLKGIVGSRE